MPLVLGNQESQIQEVVLYPVSEDITGEIDDDGVSPVYRPAVIDTTTVRTEGTAEAAWTESVQFEGEGTITIISAFYEFEWQSRIVVGSGNAATSSSKIQISGNGGTTWSDLTDNFNNTATALTSRARAGVSNVLTSITAGTTQLQFRLLHWTDDSVGGAGRSTSEANVRSSSYVRVSYRKT